MRLVGYARVSTDDKDQDPERQAELMRKWAEANGHDLLTVCKDEISGYKTRPFDRPGFNRAVREAKRLEAEGILSEDVDRITREGNDEEVRTRGVLALEHQLSMEYCCLPAGIPDWVAEMVRSMYATLGKMYRQQMVERITQGLHRSKAAGWPNGKPGVDPKPALTKEEWAVVDHMIDNNIGNRLIAVEVSKLRGAHEVADAKAHKRRKVSENWIRKQRCLRGNPASVSAVRREAKRPGRSRGTPLECEATRGVQPETSQEREA